MKFYHNLKKKDDSRILQLTLDVFHIHNLLVFDRPGYHRPVFSSPFNKSNITKKLMPSANFNILIPLIHLTLFKISYIRLYCI